MADEVWLDILPSFRRFGPNLAREATTAARRAGDQAGREYSAAFDKGSDGAANAAVRELEGAQKRASGLVSKMSGEVSKARQSQQRSAAQLLTAEQRLADAIEKYGADSRQAQAAALQVEAARAKAADATARFEQAEQGLKSAQEGSKRAAEQLAAAQKDVGTEVGKGPGLWGKLRQAMEESDGAAESARKTLGQIGGLAKTAGKGILIGVGAVTAAVAGVGALALKGGFTRAMDIEDARASLVGLGHDTKSVDGIMENALASVKGTAFGLGDAATIAATAVAAGIEPGDELTRTLKLTANSAAVARVGLGEMGSILNKVWTSGRVMTGDLNQIADRGIPIWTELADHYGVSGEEFRKMVESGKVDAATFADVLENTVGNSALAMGDTTRGSWNNMLAALSRGGESFLKDIFPLFRQGMQGVTGIIDEIAPMAEAAGAAVGSWIGDNVVPVLQRFGSWVVSDGVPALKDLAQWIGKEVAPRVAEFGRNVAETLLPPLMTFGRFLVGTVFPALVNVGKWIVKNRDWIGTLGAMVLGAVVAYKAWGMAVLAYQTITRTAMAVQAAFNAVMAANPIVLVIVAVGALAAGLYYLFTRTEWGRKVWDKVWGGIKSATSSVVGWITGTAVPRVLTAWDNFMEGVTTLRDKLARAWENVKAAFSSVGTMFTRTSTNISDRATSLRDKLARAWDNVKSAFSAVGTFFKNVYTSGIKPVFDGVAAVASFMWNRTLKPVFTMVRDSFQLTGSIIKGVYTGFIRPTVQLFGDIVKWLWQNVVRRQLDNIQRRWQQLTSAVVGFWTGRIKPMFDAFGNAMRALYARFVQPALNQISNRWNWLQAKITGFYRQRILPIITAFSQFVRVTLPTAIRAGLNAISQRWDWVAGKITGFWRRNIRPIVDAMGNFIKVTLPAAVRFGLDLVHTRWDNLRRRISSIWTDKLRPIFRNIGSFVKEDIPKMVRQGVDRIDRAWRKVANFFRKPINWVINTVWNNGIKGAFDNVAKAVKSDARLGRMKTIPAFAKGGYHKGGPALVGEQGPEIVDFDRPARITPARQTAQIIAQAQGTDAHIHPSQSKGANHGGMRVGGSIGAWAGKAWDAVKGAASGVVSWVRGGLAKAAEMTLKPVMSKVSGFVREHKKMGELGGGIIDWGVDKVLDWIRGEDQVDAGGGAVYDGPMYKGGIHRPSRGRITSRYGMRWGRLHGGIDFATGPRGAPTFAAYPGVVHSIRNYSGSGRSINLSHGGGMYTHYGHNDAVYVKQGQAVRAGQKIGTEGMSGRTTGPHLHFEKWQGGLWNRVNPNSLFDNGGWLMPGITPTVNKTGQPEAVLTPNQWDTADAAMRRMIEGRDNLSVELVDAKIEVTEDGLARFVDGRVEVKFNDKARAANKRARSKTGVR